MQFAARRLRDTCAKIVEVAVDVGYDCEEFGPRAFEWVTGSASGAWRDARAGHGGIVCP
jgi:hypothetical protein